MATGRLLVLWGMALTWVNVDRTHWTQGVCLEAIWREQDRYDENVMYICMKFSKDKLYINTNDYKNIKVHCHETSKGKSMKA